MTTSTNPETGKRERHIYSKTLTMDPASREVAMRKQFVTAARYLLRHGHCLNALIRLADSKAEP